MGAKFFGAAVKRREDPRFLRGEGRFVDDVVVSGMLHAAFVRSPHAHARIAAIDTTAASAAAGVVRVFTFKDLERWMKPLPLFGAVPPGLGAVVKFDVRQAPQWALCRDRTRHVGEIIAMVVADTPERAQDAVDLIQIQWELLPPVVDMTRAVEPGAATSGSASRTRSATPMERSPGPTSWSRRPFTSSVTSACRSRTAAWSPSGIVATGP
jgi:carbon-monoxide dehydrogenase large subunit